jgi:ubiquinone/menaquinone biosynthesis C-methylase UbiE
VSEAFQPISVKPAGDNLLLFAVRCAFDLQLLTIHRFLRRELASCYGRVLDVGAGQAPWRELLDHAEYTGLDVESAQDFGRRRTPDIVYYDGSRMPFADASFDHLLCAEVLEHVPDAEPLQANWCVCCAPAAALC